MVYHSNTLVTLRAHMHPTPSAAVHLCVTAVISMAHALNDASFLDPSPLLSSSSREPVSC